MGVPIIESLGGKPSAQGTIWNEMIPNRLFIPMIDEVAKDWEEISSREGIKKLILYSELANKMGYYKNITAQNEKDRNYWKSVFTNNISKNPESQKVLYQELAKVDPEYEKNIELLLDGYNTMTELGAVLKKEHPQLANQVEEVYKLVKQWQADSLQLFSDLPNMENIKSEIYEFLSKSRKEQKPFTIKDIMQLLANLGLKPDFGFFKNFQKFNQVYEVPNVPKNYFVELIDRDSFVISTLVSLFPEKIEQIEKSETTNFVTKYSIEKALYSSDNTDALIEKLNTIYKQLPTFYTTHSF